ncbi:two-component sensor histidine kinase [Clostridium polyendosporum]|uniref:histidine kinase n=1 Tax=Clostridium polyendosporum TaxID=69208 RepID=A0A919S046_9CLOT|nr:HAMP domain-containing sensor histidine kinase [Clostridium polyendosporum]GIM28871.1 two-component sensor histidine kinase [Clostridium polyendosporum]
MNIKNRLIIANTVIVVIPLIITTITAIGFFFISSRFFNKDISYNNFKEAAVIRANLSNILSSIQKENLLIDEEVRFEEYLSQRLSSFNGKYIVTKGHNAVLASKDINKIDIEKSIEEANQQSLDDTVKINSIYYILQGCEFNLKDGTQGKIILLAPIGEETNLFKNFILVIVVIFILSFIVVNGIMSYYFSKRILKPIELLKNAVSEISRGNLHYEIVEEGDKEIKELCRDFEVMRIQLKDSINMKMKYDENRKMLISSISHDLKTPITSIKGYVEGVLDGVANTPEKIEWYLKTIYSKAEHINVMIEDLLLYSKLDLNQLPFNFEKTDIIQYFNYCIDEIELELAKNNILISLKNDLKDSRFIKIDRERMRRVIVNIIDNSHKYMDKEKGEIVISLRETNLSTIVEIRDNGPGIDEEELSKIFDKFYRIDPSRNETKGSGLGLAIAKQIVQGHKGRIWAVSHGDKGTSIMISLAKVREGGNCYEKNINC